MLAEQNGSLVYVMNNNGFDLNRGQLILSLREARQLRDTLIGLGYTINDQNGEPEDG
jgi:hypothetical protein